MSIVSDMDDHFRKQRLDAERYRKLRRWMSSGVQEGWNEVSQLGAIGSYLSWDDFDAELDRLPDCNVGLCQVLDK